MIYLTKYWILAISPAPWQIIPVQCGCLKDLLDATVLQIISAGEMDETVQGELMKNKLKEIKEQAITNQLQHFRVLSKLSLLEVYKYEWANQSLWSKVAYFSIFSLTISMFFSSTGTPLNQRTIAALWELWGVGLLSVGRINISHNGYIHCYYGGIIGIFTVMLRSYAITKKLVTTKCIVSKTLTEQGLYL